MLALNAKTTALVVIDLQEGILPFAGGPHSANDVVARAAQLAEKFRTNGSPVVMDRVGWSADYADALKQRLMPKRQPKHYPTTGGNTRKRWESVRQTWRSPSASGEHSTVLTWNCNCAVVVSTPSSFAGSPPISASNPPRVTPGSWVLI